MASIHYEYLHKRGYNPKQLRELYGVDGCYLTGDFKYRLVIPVYQKGRVVTYVGRDVTGKSQLPYKNLAERKSILPAKECVYNIDSIHETAIIVEGIFDAWRFGVHGIATLGIQFTATQTRTIASRVRKAFICYDPEPIAQQKAYEMAETLSFQGVDVEILLIDAADPGEMTQKEADKIKRILKIT